MIPTKTDITVNGQLPGEDVRMVMDEHSLAHLMSVLTELYSNRPLAVVREYSTNALDSHIEAGVERPIEVSTPTDFMPYLKIKDYGIGMDAETIRTVYSKYGASTKRATNLQNGMLGLGAKSALAYTNQFQVTGIKNGIKTHVIVSRSDDESGVMKIIGQTQTNEPNGVEISIPASRREIDQVVFQFFKYWKPGTVLVNGRQPAHVQGMQIGDFLMTNEDVDYVVMGNVAYPVPSTHRIFKKEGYQAAGLVAYVEMGEVNFTPSRESLKMTKLTEATLDRLRNEFEKAAIAHLEKNIVNAASHMEAIQEFHKMQQTHLKSYMKGMKYQGLTFPNEFRDGFDWLTNVNYGTTQKVHYVYARELFNQPSKTLIVYGFDKAKVHSTHRSKLNLWLAQEAYSPTHIYWCEEKAGTPWTNGIKSVHWDEVAKMKLDRAGAKVKNDSYDVIDNRGYRISGAKIDDTKTLVYASPTELASDERRNMVAKVLTCDSNLQLLLVNKNKWAAFKKECPKAVHVDNKIKQVIIDYLLNLTDAEKMYLQSDWQDKEFCARLDSAKVDDPAIKQAIMQLGTNGLSRKTEEKYKLMRAAAMMWQVNFPDLESGRKTLFDSYPLLHVYSYGSHRDPLEHIYAYMNMVYKEFIK